MKVSASILSCDFSNMEKEISKIENSNLDFLHIDVMDGHFVPNISFGPHVVDCVKKISNIPFETHLMVEYPLNFVEKFKSSDIIIFHLESQNNPMDVIYTIKNMGKK
jgi:ribulose-phosphate 3-epimerase